MVKDREYFRKNLLQPLLQQGLLKPTIPDKPTSSKQKYYATKENKEINTTASILSKVWSFCHALRGVGVKDMLFIIMIEDSPQQATGNALALLVH